MEPASPRGTFRLGDWLVQPDVNRVSRGAEIHHLRPRLMDLLVYLAGKPGEVVSKDRILAEVWQQAFVTDSVLSRSVADLRRLLGDTAAEPRIIETIAKRGYRVVARVDRFDAATRNAAASLPSIAVLPFLDLAPARDQEHVCEGLAEELTNRLSRLRGLKVVARTSAFAFKGTTTDVREIGRLLGVGALLEGSVQRAGDRVRVTVQLIDTGDGCHLWSGRFDRPAGDLFAIEDETAQAVAEVLRVTLLGGSPAPRMRRQTENPAAHDLFLRGRQHAARRNGEGLGRALECYEQAVALDPRYAAAHAGIAECCVVSAFLGFVHPADVIPGAKASVDRALSIDPDLAEGHAVLGHETGMFEWNWEDAERHFVRALDLRPGYALARVWYSHLLTATGRFDEAIAQTDQACDCDPLAPLTRTAHGLALYYAREYDRAAHCLLQVLEMDPSFVTARFHLGRVYAMQGKLEEAADQHRLAGRGFPLALAALAAACRALGRDREAALTLGELEELARERYVGPLTWSTVHSGDTRLHWLSRAFDEREGIVPLLKNDPAMDPLRLDPAFRALIDRLGLP